MTTTNPTGSTPSGVRLADSLVMVAAEANRDERAVAVMFSIFAYELLPGEIVDLSGYNVETIQEMFSTITKDQAGITASGRALRESFLALDLKAEGWQEELQAALEIYLAADRQQSGS